MKIRTKKIEVETLCVSSEEYETAYQKTLDFLQQEWFSNIDTETAEDWAGDILFDAFDNFLEALGLPIEIIEDGD